MTSIWVTLRTKGSGEPIFALPILYGDRLIGKLDATADRKASVLRVNTIHRDVDFTKAMTAAVNREIADLAQWLRLDPAP